MQALTLRFAATRMTKNTVRFDEVPNADGLVYVGALYVQKHAASALGGGALTEGTVLEVTIGRAES